jgi:hypothetical protein
MDRRRLMTERVSRRQEPSSGCYAAIAVVGAVAAVAAVAVATVVAIAVVAVIERSLIGHEAAIKQPPRDA